MRRRLVGGVLRRYRENAGYTLQDAARVLECDRSKISRIETGQRGIRPKELRELLTEYGVPDREQRLLLGRGHAVLGQQLPQFLGADAALAGLDPADLGTVAFEDPGRVFEHVAHVLPVPAQRTAHHTAPHGGISGHGSCLSAD